MILKTARCLVISATAITISACAPAPHVAFEPPPRPVFYPYGEILWAQLPPEAQDAIATDDLACKRYIRQVEERARIHND